MVRGSWVASAAIATRPAADPRVHFGLRLASWTGVAEGFATATTTGRCGDLEQRQWRVWKGGSLDSSNCTSGCLTKLSELSQLDILVGGFMAKELLATSL